MELNIVWKLWTNDWGICRDSAGSLACLELPATDREPPKSPSWSQPWSTSLFSGDCCAFALIQSIQFHEYFHQFEKRLILQHYTGTALLLTWLGNCLTPPPGRNEITETCDATERTNTWTHILITDFQPSSLTAKTVSAMVHILDKVPTVAN